MHVTIWTGSVISVLVRPGVNLVRLMVELAVSWPVGRVRGFALNCVVCAVRGLLSK